MRMLDALDLASKSSGTATGAEFPRSTAANGSLPADRSISRDKDSRRRNRTTEFEERLMARIREDRTLLDLLDLGLTGIGRTLIELLNLLFSLLPGPEPTAAPTTTPA